MPKRNSVGRIGSRNGIVATNKRKKSNLKTGRDYSYDKEYQKSPARVAYRVELNRKRRQLLREGKIKKYSNVDISHKKASKKGGTLKNGWRLESKSKNRARK